MSRSEFMTVARTMLDVFPEVRCGAATSSPTGRSWRSSDRTSDSRSIRRWSPRAAARSPAATCPAEAVRALTLPFYAGGSRPRATWSRPGPLNTDDRPIIEYAAPITHREQRTGAAAWFTSGTDDVLRDVLAAAPPEPIRTWPGSTLPSASGCGYHYHAAAAYRRLGDDPAARLHTAEFAARVPARFHRPPEEEPDDRVGAWERGS
jgi:spermidine synthase